MSAKPPLLNMLPAFEASGRLSSFKLAADELCVTPSAISQQIKQLEISLDTKLFNRTTRKVELTDVGVTFYEVVRSTLEHYQTEFDKFRRDRIDPHIRLSTVPFVAHDLLIPAMHSYKSVHQGLDLRIETTENIIDLFHDKHSVAIRIGEGQWDGMKSRRLAPLQMNIVGKASLLPEAGLQDIAELKDYTLIHARTTVDDWAELGSIIGIDFSHNKHIYLDNYLSAIALAEQGVGLVIALMPITNGRINDGRLETLFPQSFDVPGRGFYFVQNEDNALIDETDNLFEWVLNIFDNSKA